MKRIFLFTLLFTALIALNSCSIFKGAGGKKEQKVLIQTDFGNITLKLYNDTPNHRDNFIKLVKEGVYDGTLFHRVIPEFMIQGGDPESKNAKAGESLGKGDLGYKQPAEFTTTHIHKRGAIAAARQGDRANPKKESSASQFYIVVGKKVRTKDLERQEKKYDFKYTEEQIATYKEVGGTPFLDQSYTVFGEVIEGMDVVDKITAVRRNKSDRPDKDVKMNSVKLIK